MSVIDRVPEYIKSLVPYVPGKPVEEVEREYGVKDSVKLASNENPLGPSPAAMKALRERLHLLHFYPDGDCFHLKRGVAERLGVSPEELIFGNGSNELIELAVRTFMRPGEETIMARHSFVIFLLVVQAAGGSCSMIPMKDYVHDLEAIADAVTSRTRIVFLANPNNPTGTIYRKKEWERFLNRVPESTLVIADEAYFEYVADPEYPNSLAYHGEGRSILTLRTFSKLYGLAGLRIGYAVGNRRIVDLMHRVRQPFNVNAAAQWAALAALDDRTHVAETLRINRDGMAYLMREMARLGMETVSSHANFILVKVGSGQEVYQRLMRRGVIVRPMGGYELPEHVRVTVGTMEENRKFVAELEALFEGGR
jgi:histidinol-phosphate aminotransferase